ncbi:hypothetical protein QBC35DRAFT_475591 [Podospora australis]|uniref:Uncharacterized protein n=1 Tax=Podospora australis TaxID=1536484 RepID=A0AAN6WQI2_9PEZI|nr:hypothetical protein QBC35DRAFT_475591 [Podospora australis]
MSCDVWHRDLESDDESWSRQGLVPVGCREFGSRELTAARPARGTVRLTRSSAPLAGKRFLYKGPYDTSSGNHPAQLWTRASCDGVSPGGAARPWARGGRLAWFRALSVQGRSFVGSHGASHGGSGWLEKLGMARPSGKQSLPDPQVTTKQLSEIAMSRVGDSSTPGAAVALSEPCENIPQAQCRHSRSCQSCRSWTARLARSSYRCG